MYIVSVYWQSNICGFPDNHTSYWVCIYRDPIADVLFCRYVVFLSTVVLLIAFKLMCITECVISCVENGTLWIICFSKSINCTAWLDCLFKFQVDQAVGYCSHYFGSDCWLLFPLFWIRLLVTIPIILDHAVGYCSHYFGSGCWLLFR